VHNCCVKVPEVMGKNTGSEDAGIDRKSHMGYDQTAWSGLPLRGAIAGALLGTCSWRSRSRVICSALRETLPPAREIVVP
jgi:hypothetical protein